MSRWYRAYEGTVTDAKLAEVALVVGCSRSVVIATWHAVLENAACTNDGGRIDIPSRRIAAVLCEPFDTIEGVMEGFETVGLIAASTVTSWKRRQFESDSSTERSRKHREAKRNGDATLQQQEATPPETETENTPPSEPNGSSGGKRKRARPAFELPSIIPAELWAEFEAMRARKKKPLTDFGRKQLVGKLVNIAAAGWNIEDVMAKAIVGCHDGFWMPDGRDSNIRRANEPRAGPVNLDEYRERLARIGKAEG